MANDYIVNQWIADEKNTSNVIKELGIYGVLNEILTHVSELSEMIKRSTFGNGVNRLDQNTKVIKSKKGELIIVYGTCQTVYNLNVKMSKQKKIKSICYTGDSSIESDFDNIQINFHDGNNIKSGKNNLNPISTLTIQTGCDDKESTYKILKFGTDGKFEGSKEEKKDIDPKEQEHAQYIAEEFTTRLLSAVLGHNSGKAKSL